MYLSFTDSSDDPVEQRKMPDIQTVLNSSNDTSTLNPSQYDFKPGFRLRIALVVLVDTF